MEIPRDFGHVLEILILVDEHTARLPSPLRGREGRRDSAGRRGRARAPLRTGFELRKAARHHTAAFAVLTDRTSVASGMRVSVRVDLGGPRSFKKQRSNYNTQEQPITSYNT